MSPTDSPYVLLLDTGSDLDGPEKWQKAVTIDAPTAVGPYDHAFYRDGLVVTAIDENDDQVWAILPLPDSEWTRGAPDGQGGYLPDTNLFESAEPMCYTWRSKVFVMPGNTNFGYAKVVHDCGGTVKLNLYADCKCVYSTVVRDCNPFTLPLHLSGVSWEIELVGTATVREVHIASSMEELLRSEN